MRDPGLDQQSVFHVSDVLRIGCFGSGKTGIHGLLSGTVFVSCYVYLVQHIHHTGKMLLYDHAGFGSDHYRRITSVRSRINENRQNNKQ